MVLCKECIFSCVNMDSGQYECRFNPPKVFMVPQQGSGGQMQLGALSLFPVVQANQWCGEATGNEEGAVND